MSTTSTWRARTYARRSARPMPAQTHHGCEWLDQEDGEQDVLRDWRERDRCNSSATHR